MNRPEQQLQQACVKWFALQYPQHKGRLFAINNNSKSARMGAINKSMGVVPGVADMCFICGCYIYFLEFKVKGRKPSKVQMEWATQVTKANNRVQYFIFWDFDNFKTFVTATLNTEA